jgi:hypothetical protein
VHNFRAPKSAAAAASAASAPRATKSSSGGGARSAGRAAPMAEPPLSPPDHEHVVLYQTTEKFPVGTWLSHKTFGIGVVLRELATNKIEVRFDAGPKVLVHNLTPVT